MTARIKIGAHLQDADNGHVYYLEIIEGPHLPIYVHASMERLPDGLVRAMISYQPLDEAVGQPFHDEACSIYAGSRIRV